MAVDLSASGAGQVVPPAPGARRPWRSIVLAPRGDGQRRRRGSDAFRLGTAAVALVVGLLVVRLDPAPEHRLATFLHPPPFGINWLASTVALIGSLGLIAVLAVVSFLSGRRWLLRDVLVSGAGAALLCGLMWLVFGTDGGRPTDASLSGFDLQYPVISIAVTVAVATAALPSLARPIQRLVEFLIAAAAVATVVRGAGLPVNVAASVAAGWGVTATMHLWLGSPLGLPSGEEVAVGLTDLGVSLAGVKPAAHQVWGVARYEGTDAQGRRVSVSLYGRDAADAQVLAKLGRLLLYRDSGPSLHLGRLQHVEHEAYMTLLAQRLGVDVPEVVVAGVGGPTNDAMLVTRRPDGMRFSDLTPPVASALADEPSPEEEAARAAVVAEAAAVVTDDVLDALFRSLSALRADRLAHGALSGDTVLVSPGRPGVTLLDFRNGSSSAPAERLDADLAGGLATAALVAGPERTAAAAARVLDPSTVAAALPRLRRAGLDPALARALRGRGDLLDRLRTACAAEVGIEVPALAEPKRLGWGTVVLALGTLIGGWALIGVLVQVTKSLDTIKGANWAWVVVVALLSQVPYPATAVSVLGSVNGSLVYFRVVALEVADSFVALAGGTPAVFGTRVRFFQVAGYDTPTAITSGALVSTASWAVKGGLFLISLPLVWGSFDFSEPSTSGGGHAGAVWLLLAVIVLVLAAIGAVLAVPRLRRLAANKVRPKLADIWADLKVLSATPSKLVELFGGAVVAQTAVALALGASLHAFGQSLSLASLFVVITLASMLGGVSPVPGGMGVVEAGMILGLTAAGIGESQAVAAVFVQRLFTSYLPPIGGWFTLVAMRKKEYL
jgi:uncharacterized membrane protein YbhN (UPF0104 family)